MYIQGDMGIINCADQLMPIPNAMYAYGLEKQPASAEYHKLRAQPLVKDPPSLATLPRIPASRIPVQGLPCTYTAPNLPTHKRPPCTHGAVVTSSS